MKNELKLKLETKYNLIDVIHKKSNISYKIIILIFIGLIAGMTSEYTSQFNEINDLIMTSFCFLKN